MDALLLFALILLKPQNPTTMADAATTYTEAISVIRLAALSKPSHEANNITRGYSNIPAKAKPDRKSVV